MTPEQMRELAGVLEPMAAAPRFDDLPVVEFCAWVRQCAEAEPVARICTDAEMRHRDGRWGRVKWIEAESELPEGALLYTHPAPAYEKTQQELDRLTRELAEARAERDALAKALTFYAKREHFILSDDTMWDTVSGEPPNWWCDEAGTATVEDGSIARLVLAGGQSAADVIAQI